jgi:glycosyltransferase involved in cell wall biosynthesis
MSLLPDITVLVLTLDEAPNIGRTLEALRSFPKVVVLDSGSTDGTREIASGFPNVRLFHRAFDSLAAQWNHGLANCGIDTEWVLALDADYLLSPALVQEIAALAPQAGIAGYRASFLYAVHGRVLSGTLYPPVTVLVRRALAHYRQDGHAHRVDVKGGVAPLSNKIVHDDRKPLARWLASQARYASEEAELLLSTPWRELKLQDRIRRLMVIAPWLVPLYCLTVGKGLFDGRAGLYYALQRSVAESILALRLLERALGIPR